MLTITVLGAELFDEEKQEFDKTEDVTIELEHSLAALQRWESKWEIPFLGNNEKTTEQVLGYVEAMCLTPNVPPEVFTRLSDENMTSINEYLEAKMTATWFNDDSNPSKSREIITAELIYYWMTQLNIPFECENWHLNRLFTLIKVANLKQSKPKKMSKAEVMARNRALNEQRRSQLGTSG